MKIIKYSKQNGSKYKLFLEDGNKILLHENVILDKELLIKKEVDDVTSLVNENQKYDILDSALKYISYKTRSVNEMTNYLQKKGYLETDISKTITYLLQKGYLNDIIYARSYVMDRINLSNDGPYKIIKSLEKEGITSEIYQDSLNLFTKELIYERINKYIAKLIKSNKKSKYALQNKIMLNLINLGYSKEDINHCLNSMDNIDDRKNYENAKEKLYQKLSRKYEGSELERKVKEKLYQQGYFE